MYFPIGQYETAIGTFDGAIDPNTESFRDFPHWADTRLREVMQEKVPKRIAMFCTGGIRCEKASSYLQDNGFGEVHHLRGGESSIAERVRCDLYYIENWSLGLDLRILIRTLLTLHRQRNAY